MCVRRSLFGLLILVCVLLASPLMAAMFRLSVDSKGVQGNDYSWAPSISADGNVVAFMSLANNLVAGDTNGARDIFVRNRLTGETRRVSLASDGAQANGDSWEPAISADGNWVAFSSDATNLVPGDTNGKRDVFVRNLQTGETVRVSVATGGGQANGNSREPRISGDGRVIAFTSDATNLVPGDTNGVADVFIHNRSTGGTDRVSAGASGQGNGPSRDPAISSDGSVVAFCSAASNLVAGDTNGADDVFVRSAGAIIRVSVSSTGAQGNSHSQDPSISGDGRLVVFKSFATNLVADDTNQVSDIFLYDLQAKSTQRVNLTSFGKQADADSVDPAISRDGGFVAFASRATNLAVNDTNGLFDIFLRDRSAGITRRLSAATRAEANGNSWGPSVSDNGVAVAFWSEASNLVTSDTNGKADVFLSVPGPGGGGGGGGEELGGCYGLRIDGGGLALMYTVFVPISINQSNDVGAMNFWVSFDPKVLQCSTVQTQAVQSETVLTNGWELQFNIDNAKGIVKIAMASDQPLAPDLSGIVAYLSLVPTQGAAAGGSTTFTISNVSIYDVLGNPLPLCTGPGGEGCIGSPVDFVELQKCPHPDDVNRDQQISVDDAILLLQAAVEFPAPANWPFDWPPKECNDVNGDGKIDSGDAVMILGDVAAGLDIPFPLPIEVAATAGTASVAAATTSPVTSAAVGVRTLSLPAMRVDPGGSATVALAVDDATGIAGADFDIRYDPALIQVSAARASTLSNGFLLVSNINNSTGRLGIAMAKASGIANGSGALVYIDLRAIGAGGKSALHFQEYRLYDQQPAQIPATAVDGSVEIAYSTGFSDVPADYWAAEEIAACVKAGIVSGYPDGSYQPTSPVTRDQMAAFISRALAHGDANVPASPGTVTFGDVPMGHWAYRYVEYAYAQKVVTGYDDGLYHPAEQVNRGQMAVFVARAMKAPLGDAGIPMHTGAPTFPDVTADNTWSWCFNHVEYIASQGVTQGYADKLYHPEYTCTRDLMAVYIARAFGLPL